MNKNMQSIAHPDPITAQAGELLVSLGTLLTSLPALCEGGPKTGKMLIRVGQKLIFAAADQRHFNNARTA